jgi:23S rRNA pseudouridine1911/1915/1917 synthase
LRLDTYISRKFDISRSYSKSLIEAGNIQVDLDIVTDPSFNIINSSVRIKRKSKKIKVLYECDHFLVVYKPYDMSVCRSNTTPKTENVLNEELQKNYSLCSTEKPWEFGLVNRIDKLTEGLIMLCKNQSSYLFFKNLFRNRIVKKHYYAYYAQGTPDLDFSCFLCSHGLYHFSMSSSCFCEEQFENIQTNIIENGTAKTCLTNICRKKEYFLCEIITGRTHQIRKTMRDIGMPVWGDIQYGEAQERMLLFSVSLSFPLEIIKNYLK